MRRAAGDVGDGQMQPMWCRYKEVSVVPSNFRIDARGRQGAISGRRQLLAVAGRWSQLMSTHAECQHSAGEDDAT